MVSSKAFEQWESCFGRWKQIILPITSIWESPPFHTRNIFLCSYNTINKLFPFNILNSSKLCSMSFLVFELFWKLFYTVIIFPCQKCQVALKMKQHISLDIWYLLLWKGNNLTLPWISKSFIWVFSDVKMYTIFVMTFSDFKFILMIEITNQEIQKLNKSKKRIMFVAEVLKERKLLNQLRSPVKYLSLMKC